jgi:hypothetical protein
MDDYMTTKEAAKKWHISVRQVQNYCKKRDHSQCDQGWDQLLDAYKCRTT